MKIPRRLNAALDWIAGNAAAVSVVLLLVVAAIVALWLPVLGAFAVGVAVGGAVVHIRMSKKVAALRAETDDLLRENGALRYQKTLIAKGAAVSASVLTQKLPSIPEEDDE